MKVYLDDERPAPEGWIRTSSVTTVRDYLETGKVTHLSLDHDLGKNFGSGYDVLLWLEAQVALGRWKHELPEITIHSANPVGRQKMLDALKSIQRLVLNKNKVII